MKNKKLQGCAQQNGPFVRTFLRRFGKPLLWGTVLKTLLTVALWVVLTLGYLPHSPLVRAKTELQTASAHILEQLKARV